MQYVHPPRPRWRVCRRRPDLSVDCEVVTQGSEEETRGKLEGSLGVLCERPYSHPVSTPVEYAEYAEAHPLHSGGWQPQVSPYI